MQKFTFAALALAGAAALASCNQDEATPQVGPSSDLVTLTFSYTLGSGTPFLTKSSESEFLFSLTPTAPLSLTITDGAGKAYAATTGKSVTLPVGTYTVSHQDAKPDIFQHFNADAYFTQVPLVAVNQTIVVTPSTTSVQLTAQYTSAAILFDLAEVQTLKFQTSSGSTQDLAYATGGGLGAFFLNGSIENKSCVVTAIAKDGYETAAIVLNTDGSGGANKVEAGKYYFLRLAGQGVSAAFSFSVMDWTDGGTLQ